MFMILQVPYVILSFGLPSVQCNNIIYQLVLAVNSKP